MFLKKTIRVFGDSHADVFNSKFTKLRMLRVNFEVCLVKGATAQGLRNPNSKTNAVEVYKKEIEKIVSNSDPLLFQLGEVDTGFVIWYRSQKYNEEIELQLSNSIHSYAEFIKWVKSRGFNTIIVMSAPLPTIGDSVQMGEVANLRSSITATQKERTELTLEYNRRLKLMCNELGLIFLSLDQYLLNSSTEVIFSKYLNKNPSNHHLDNRSYSKVIKNELTSILNSL